MIDKAPILEFKRASRSKGGSRFWVSRCGRYRVYAHELCYGVKLRPIRYTAEKRDASGFFLMFSTHKTRDAAITSCEKHSE